MRSPTPLSKHLFASDITGKTPTAERQREHTQQSCDLIRALANETAATVTAAQGTRDPCDDLDDDIELTYPQGSDEVMADTNDDSFSSVKEVLQSALDGLAWILVDSAPTHFVHLSSSSPNARASLTAPTWPSPNSRSTTKRAQRLPPPRRPPNLQIVTYNCTSAASLKGFLRETTATIVAAQELHAAGDGADDLGT